MKWKKPLQILVFLLPVLFLFFQGYIHRWNSEDAFISFRVVDNLISGYGPVYNIDERVEAYTHPLWIAILSLSAKITKSIELSAVWLGLIFSCIGLLFGIIGGLKTLKGEDRKTSLYIPLGAFVIASLPPYWDYTTSGLETGLTFLWLGFSLFITTDFLKKIERLSLALLWFSLGTIVRPDLGIFWIGFLIMTIAILTRVHGKKIGFSLIFKFLFFSFILPLSYQIFRMGYFASLLPNPAFAKEAFRLNIRQGLMYLWDFMSPYALYIPATLSIIGTFYFVSKNLISSKENIVNISFFILGLFHITYVVLIGGDFMHGRFLLPGFFSIFLGFPFIPLKKNYFETLLITSILTWCIICIANLRISYVIGKYGITNERKYYVECAGQENPVKIKDYTKCGFYGIGMDARRSNYLYHENIGIAGFIAGRKIHVFDRLGLADPIASRLVIYRRGRPGHEKDMPIEWVLARIDLQSKDLKVRYAKKAMECGKLKEYLDAIQGELNLKKFLRNILVAIKTMQMRIPVDPYEAMQKFCQN